MLGRLMELLCEDLAIEMPKLKEGKLGFLRLGAYVVEMRELDPGISLTAPIGPLPKEKEDAFTYCLRANLLGQGTGGARIGLSANERFLTLSLGLPYEMNYQAFREKLEDFINYLVYWREEVTKFMKQTTLL